MGPPGQPGGEDFRVAFAGYTPGTFAGDLGGRSGAHEICGAAFPGSHFCTDWEVDQSHPPPASAQVWIDFGDAQTTTRRFRPNYYTSDVSTCGGWTQATASDKPDGLSVGRGYVLTPLGGFQSTFVSNTDGGCETQRALACCTGGTMIRFRGFTAPKTGNLSGRSGAHATCAATFNGSHFCSDWEVDQAAVRAPIPATGAWIDFGDAQPSTRRYHPNYYTSDVSTCAGWTQSTAADKPDGLSVGRGYMLTPLGGFSSTFVSNTDGGCETARPIACCDGTPPQ